MRCVGAGVILGCAAPLNETDFHCRIMLAQPAQLETPEIRAYALHLNLAFYRYTGHVNR
jgi:hypothetical protein